MCREQTKIGGNLWYDIRMNSSFDALRIVAIHGSCRQSVINFHSIMTTDVETIKTWNVLLIIHTINRCLHLQVDTAFPASLPSECYLKYIS